MQHISVNSPTLVAGGASSLPEYQRPLSFYGLAPSDDITIEEFENFSFQRLEMLRKIESKATRGLTSEEESKKLADELRNVFNLSTPEGRRQDVISHHTLRLAFSAPDRRSWFVKMESDLLSLRLRFGGDVKQFIESNGMHMEPVSRSNFATLASDLDAVRAQLSAADQKMVRVPLTPDAVSKVPFAEASELVWKRSVLLRDGYAYVFNALLLPVIISRYRLALRRGLQAASNQVPTIQDSHTQLGSLFGALQKYDPGANYEPSGGTVDLASLDMLAKRSFPLCMRYLKGVMDTDHKLKHWGRQQYGLFLKGIGITLPDALQYWQSHFTRVMSDKDFDRNYAYNIRYNYGKEGKRTDWSPYSCSAILNMQPPVASDDRHGCPFRELSATQLTGMVTAELESANLPDAKERIEEVTSLAARNHYQLACKALWEASRPVPTHSPDGGAELREKPAVTHPNEYFDAAEAYRKALEVEREVGGVMPVAVDETM
uniref:DNA primase large subunit C-terminal domain-containing protein n=1 Tax=Sexangularia sp. CB-2014 TaxID=1486929 RepID=A0A7S1VDY5_9EUKA